MRNYRITLDISSENDITALNSAAEIAAQNQCLVNLVCALKTLRVDETGTIVGVVKRVADSKFESGVTVDRNRSDLDESDEDIGLAELAEVKSA